MSALRRPAVLVLGVGVLLTGYFFFAVLHASGLAPARTAHGRLFGLLGFATIVGSGISRLWEQRGGVSAGWNTWHNALGFLSVWLILLHSYWHFGSGIALLAFLLLLSVVGSGAAATWVGRPSASALPQPLRARGQPGPASPIHVGREWWILFHLALTVGLFTFSLLHILAIFYY
jgi:hypothetical protein